MDEKTVTFENLPIGTGSALGTFIRGLYLTASQKYTIVGISIKDEKGLYLSSPFSRLENIGTAIANDLILHLTTEYYYISQELILHNYTEKKSLDDIAVGIFNGLYYIEVSTDGVISKHKFSSAFIPVSDYLGHMPSEDMVSLASDSAKLTVGLYVSLCRGNFTQADANEFLDSCNIKEHVFPVAGCAQRASNCWFTIDGSQTAAMETLTIHLKGDPKCIEADAVELKRLCSTFTKSVNDKLENLTKGV